MARPDNGETRADFDRGTCVLGQGKAESHEYRAR